ncbi:MAG: hypothetical protein ACFFHV_19115 [Promethearchaeota archaeon]
MIEYYCHYCNKNVNVEKKKLPICKICGFYMSKGAKSQVEILNIQQERTAYCGKCGKEVYSVPIKVIKDVVRDRFNKELSMVEGSRKQVKRSSSIDRRFLFVTIVMIPVFIMLLMILWWLGFLLIGAFAVALILDFQHKIKLKGDLVAIRDNKIKELAEEKQKALNELSKAEQDFENLIKLER